MISLYWVLLITATACTLEDLQKFNDGIDAAQEVANQTAGLNPWYGITTAVLALAGAVTTYLERKKKMHLEDAIEAAMIEGGTHHMIKVKDLAGKLDRKARESFNSKGAMRL